jgi:hypothetical protein
VLNRTTHCGKPVGETRHHCWISVKAYGLGSDRAGSDYLAAPEDAVQIDHSSKSTVVMSGSEGVMAQIETELRSIAVIVDDVIATSTPTLDLLEFSRAIQMALVILSHSRAE